VPPNVCYIAVQTRTSWRPDSATQEYMGLIGKVVRFATLVLVLTAVLALCPGLAVAASPEGHLQLAQQSSEGAATKSEAAEAWDAVKNTTNPALLEAFIKRYGSTFFAEIAKARLEELKAAAAKARSQMPSLPALPKDGVRERAVLYEEDPADAKGRRFEGSVVWRSETIKTAGKPDELAARAYIDIPSRGLRMKMSLRRNLDPSLPASHVIDLTIAVSSDFDGGGIANVPGILMKANEKARGTPLAGLSVKVTEGFFLVGLSNATPADRERNLKLLLERPWFDIPVVYSNQHRAILAIEKGGSGQQAFKSVFTAWGEYRETIQSGSSPADESNNSMPEDRSMPEEWKRSMKDRPKTP
jgi:hypothetical protein